MASVLLAFGSAGCQKSSSLENQVYSYMDSFSRKIPKDFVKGDGCYHDKSLEMESCAMDSEDINGSGRSVFFTKEVPFVDGIEAIATMYADSKEIKAFQKSEDPNELKTNKGFMRFSFDLSKLSEKEIKEIRENIPYDNLIILGYRKDLIVYSGREGVWRKYEGLNVKDFENIDFDELPSQPSIEVKKSEVNKYLKLAERFKKTYFSG